MLILYRNNTSCYCFKSLVALQVNYYYDHVIVTIDYNNYCKLLLWGHEFNTKPVSCVMG